MEQFHHNEVPNNKVPFDIDNLDLDAIKAEVLKDRPFGAAKAPTPESYDFSEGNVMGAADKKALDRENLTAANDHSTEEKKAA